MGAASDGGGQLPLGALAAAVQDEVCAGPGGHGRLRLGALGLGLLLLLCGWTAPPREALSQYSPSLLLIRVIRLSPFPATLLRPSHSTFG